MNHRNSLSILLVLVLGFASSFTLKAQEQAALESITAAELRDHIFFLASDYLQGRVATTPEYQIAAQYVATQFAAAGLEPVMTDAEGNKSYFQGVPFARTVYSDKLQWNVEKNGEKKELIHREDFKIMFGRELNHERLPIVWAGYGIEEADEKWNDFENLDLTGTVVVCLAGAPMKKGKAVFSEAAHEKYAGERGVTNKIYRGLFRKGAAAIILVDLDGTGGINFEELPSEFETEKTAYQGNSNRRGRTSFPSVYVAKPSFLKTIMGDLKANPLNNPDNVLKNYKPQVLENTYLNGSIEVLTEDVFPSNNVIGMVRGTDPELQNEYIVVGAHLDHVRPRQGQVCNGADDNASGSAGVMEIAEAVAMNPFKRSVLFVTWTAEEMGLIGSRFFVSSDAFPKDQLKFNLNMDMIGRSSPKNEDSRAHYVVTNKKYVEQLELFINGLNSGVTDFPLIYDNDQDSPGGSDHQSFIGADIPAFFFFSGLHPDLHQPTDDADKIDYPKAERLCKLGYKITEELANGAAVPTFLAGTEE